MYNKILTSFNLLILCLLFFGSGTDTFREFGKVKLNNDGDELQFKLSDVVIAGIDSSDGGLYLKPTKTGLFRFNGSDLEIENTNVSTPIIIRSDHGLELWNNVGASSQCMLLDSTIGIVLMQTNMQVKVPLDTASDYNSDDAVTLNRQVGLIKTKALTTAAGTKYTLTISNSLVGSNSNQTAVTVTLQGGTNTTRPVVVGQVFTNPVTPNTFTVDLENLSGSSLNGTLIFKYEVHNKP